MDWQASLESTAAIVVGAFLLDLAIGDPRWLPHPVVLMGKLISLGERLLLSGKPRKDFLAGVEDFRQAGVELRLSTDDGTAGHHGLVTDLLTDLATDLARPAVGGSSESADACRIGGGVPQAMRSVQGRP